MRYAAYILTNVCRLLLSATFILSGYVKAIDPLGTQYKIKDYLEALSLYGVFPDWTTLAASVTLSAAEFSLGILLLFAIQRRVISRTILALMVIMTVITVWIFFYDPVQDCGCFGDALKLTNGQTLAKNIVLTICAATVAARPMKMPRLISKTNQWIVINYTVNIIYATSQLSLYTLT